MPMTAARGRQAQAPRVSRPSGRRQARHSARARLRRLSHAGMRAMKGRPAPRSLDGPAGGVGGKRRTKRPARAIGSPGPSRRPGLGPGLLRPWRQGAGRTAVPWTVFNRLDFVLYINTGYVALPHGQKA